MSYPAGTVFNRLVHLRICTCETEWINLLMRMLRNSPSLRVLEIEQVIIIHIYFSTTISERLICSTIHSYPRPISFDLTNHDRAGVNQARYLNVLYAILKPSNGNIIMEQKKRKKWRHSS